jgi:hypothetical protein
MLVVTALSLLGGCTLSDLPWNAPAGEVSRGAETGRKQDPALVTRAQRLLNELGYKAGPADGVAGPKTRQAVRAYQKKSGLPADGQLSAALLRRLEASLRAAGSRPAAPAASRAAADAKAGDPPRYEAGSTFVYSDGRVDTVVGLKGDTVRWQRNDGTKFTAYRNFLLPWAYWQSETESGKSTLDGKPWALWPRSMRQEVAFSAVSVVQPAAGALKSAGEDWRCRLSGRQKVTVVAGSFDTLKLACERAATTSSPALSRVWYYAPSIQHYVRLEDRGKAPAADTQVELVAIRPGGEGWPPIARAALSRAVEQALETVSDGEQAPWRSSGVDTRVTIKPTSRFESGAGRLCRTFLQTWSDNRGRRRYPGAACRDDSGRWHIPGLDDGSEEALAISTGVS